MEALQTPDLPEMEYFFRLQQPLEAEILIFRSVLCAFMASVRLLHSIPFSRS